LRSYSINKDDERRMAFGGGLVSKKLKIYKAEREKWWKGLGDRDWCIN